MKYEEAMRSNKIADSTGDLASEHIDEYKQLEADIKKLEIDISELEYKEAKYKETISILTYKERTILEARILNPDFDLDEIGRISYWEAFRETRNDDTIAKILNRAYNKLERI